MEFTIRPKPVSVKPLPQYRLYIEFEDGKRGIFDATPYIKGDWYGQLKNQAVFNAVTVTEGTVTWPDGQDICPDCVYEETIAQN